MWERGQGGIAADLSIHQIQFWILKNEGGAKTIRGLSTTSEMKKTRHNAQHVGKFLICGNINPPVPLGGYVLIISGEPFHCQKNNVFFCPRAASPVRSSLNLFELQKRPKVVQKLIPGAKRLNPERVSVGRQPPGSFINTI